MPSSYDNSPPELFDVCLAVTMRRTLAIAGAIPSPPDLQTHTRLPQNRSLVLVLHVTYGVLLYMAVRWRRFFIPGGVAPWLEFSSALLFPSAGASRSFAYLEFELRPAFVLGDTDGLDLLPEVLSVAPQARAVVLKGIRELETYRRAGRLDARGLVAKDEPTEVLLQAIAKVHAGEVWIDRRLLVSVPGKITPKGPVKISFPERA